MNYESIVLYSCLSAVPAWFLFYSLNRIRRHWRDGREGRTNSCTSTLWVKLAMECPVIGLTAVKSYYVMAKPLQVRVFFILFLLAWVLSFFMLLFEFLFKLSSKWRGHRMFLALGFGIWVVLIFTHLDEFHDQVIENFDTGMGVYIPAGFFNLCLFLMNLWRPNEFKRSLQRYDKLLLKSTRSSYVKETSMFGKLNVKIRDYKIKEVDGRSVVIYNICVQFQEKVQYVKKQYKDFEKLSNSIKLSFPRSDFPNLNYPELPRILNQGIPTDEKLIYLNEFLSKTCQVDFCNDEVLKFLEIQGYVHDMLLKEHLDILDCYDAVIITESDPGHIDLSAINYNHSIVDPPVHEIFSKFVEVSLKVNQLESSKVEYIVFSRSCIHDRELTKTFKDFMNLHSQLKKRVNRLLMPKFPKKSYFSLISKSDSQSAEVRRRKLEDYLRHVLNDPVYHFEELFQFIGFLADFKELWQPSPVAYKLLQIEWEPGVDEDETIIFLLSLEKVGEKSAWQVKRQYKDFEWIHKLLLARESCENLQKYYNFCNITPGKLPDLPKKLTSLTGNIETLRESLETYLRQLLNFPYLLDSHAFVRFVNDNC